MFGEDTPKISQHGFSDGKKWHCSVNLCCLSMSFSLFEFGLVFCSVHGRCHVMSLSSLHEWLMFLGFM